MKKILLIVCALALAAGTSFAQERKDQYGLGIKAGASSKTTNLDNAFDEWGSIPSSKSLTESNGLFGFEAFYEKALGGENGRSYLGVKLGYENLSDDELSWRLSIPYGPFPAGNYKLTMEGAAVPLSVYYKYDLSGKFNVYAGVGVTWAFAKLKDGPDDYKENKIFPHINTGAEWRIGRVVGLGVDMRYSFGSKMKKLDDIPQIFEKDIMLDLNGLSGSVVLRFYF